ncbi:MAG: alpha/beta hydrolase [Alphaproteobacteria bacterium]|nr:alpha/beta hydrolase [Alphaproteobacteria bacterium]
MRHYLPTNAFIYKNIQTNSDKKVVYLSGLGMDIRRQREGFIRRYALNQGVSYLALDCTRFALANQDIPDYNLRKILPATMDMLAQDDKKLFLFGACYGGLMALKIAAAMPEKVSGVIALSPPYETKAFPWIDDTLLFLLKREKQFERRKANPEIIRQMILFRKMYLIAAMDQGRESIQPTFQGPVHIFHGQKDRLIPAENSLHVQRALNNPQCIVHVTPMTGHNLSNDYEMKMPICALGECLSRS